MQYKCNEPLLSGLVANRPSFVGFSVRDNAMESAGVLCWWKSRYWRERDNTVQQQHEYNTTLAGRVYVYVIVIWYLAWFGGTRGDGWMGLGLGKWR